MQPPSLCAFFTPQFHCHILIYVLAPVTILAYIAFYYFVQLPYRFLIAAFDAFYPIYVFVGATSILAVLIGFSAKWITVQVQESLERPLQSPDQATSSGPQALPRPPAYSQSATSVT
ncbi:hypothetical protein DL96DRAFT_79587 [Flagelloscypha sp. PMI_526]|nr:hypothetical protein DL96DRAFT_79587 [Flagelloscypha sp. PMI_526]